MKMGIMALGILVLCIMAWVLCSDSRQQRRRHIQMRYSKPGTAQVGAASMAQGTQLILMFGRNCILKIFSIKCEKT